jgi:hypothetical protein
MARRSNPFAMKSPQGRALAGDAVEGNRTTPEMRTRPPWAKNDARPLLGRMFTKRPKANRRAM